MTCAFADAEHALDPEYAAKLGVRTLEELIGRTARGYLDTAKQRSASSQASCRVSSTSRCMPT